MMKRESLWIVVREWAIGNSKKTTVSLVQKRDGWEEVWNKGTLEDQGGKRVNGADIGRVASMG